MRNFLKIIAFCLALVSLFPSCRMVSSVLHDEKVVARAGSEVLYESEVLQLIPEGTSPEDSLRILMQYAETWAKDAIILKTAEEQLSKEAKDVTSELEEYRRSLLKYRYEELFINERLDTTVTDEEIEEFYAVNADDFILSQPIYKARYVKVYSDSPDIAILKKKMSSDSDVEVYEADSIAYSSAIRFTDYGGGWVDEEVLAKETELSALTLSSTRLGTFLQTSDNGGRLNILYLVDKVSAGNIPPVEYCRDIIVDRILSIRKHRLVTDLEQDLLRDARDKGKFVIY